ncbi:MAG: 50S ribosomal protein L18 [Firmicutes bacterium HGW-Firmicutes-14]|nr:MAG: 50S ribosomal protein L18 [Firmicutes bacterium HGW-Firmicutes-14]
MFKRIDRKAENRNRHLRVRKRVHGTTERPRLSVYRSLNNIYAQIIDDTKGITLVSASTMENGLKGKVEKGSNLKAAEAVGKSIAEKALEKGIKQVVFDRGGHIYHGRIKALANAAREAGLEF